ncbi:MAG: class I adenylate-forming enzyme family protein [bacterium]|nr:class I adenylate-forming enzyme family protein [bacterium]
MEMYSKKNVEWYDDVEHSIYDYQKKYTKDYKKLYAGRFFKRNISYQEIDDQIEKLANRYHAKGVNPTEVIAVISPMTPEVLSAFYSINKNGAVFFPIDPRNNATRIKDFLNLTEVKKVIVLDMAYAKLDAIIDGTKIDDVIVTSVMDSMFPLLGLSYHYSQMQKTKQYYDAISHIGFDDNEQVQKLLENLKKKAEWTSNDKALIKNLEIYQKTRDIALKNIYYTNPPKTGYINFKEAMKEAKNLPQFDSIYDENIPATLTLTSGTTGKPKVVPTMNRSFNVKVRDYALTTMPIEPGDRILAMPPFILYGETFMHMAYVRGVQNVIVPDITAYHYPDVIRKEKISHAVGVPSQALTLAEDKKFNTKSNKYLKTVSVGGTKMLKEHERKINESLNKLGISVTQGYSMSELTPSSMTNMPGYIREGSVGIPLGDTKALVIDSSTQEILGTNQVGTLLIHSETQFTGYYKNEADNKKVFVKINGITYVNTGDKAYYDEDGYYYIQGRDKEMIIRPDGHNNFPSEMEELIVGHPYVEDCAVVGVPYPDYNSPTGEYPKAHVVLKEGFKGNEGIIDEELRKYCSENLPERDIPYFYQFHDKLPLTPVLKIDKLALRELDKQQSLAKEKILLK